MLDMFVAWVALATPRIARATTEPMAATHAKSSKDARSDLVQLEALLLRELSREWHRLNDSYFKSTMKAPSIELSDAEVQLGSWEHETRTLRMARKLIREQLWPVVIDVMKHEMAHQYVSEVLGVSGESAHGPTFRDVCQRLGIDASSRGMPRPVGDDAERDPVGAKVAKLLALAESPNPHEAEAAMLAARRLMEKHNVQPPTSGGYVYAHLGTPAARTWDHQRRVGAVLSSHFFVEVIWVPVFDPTTGKRLHVLEACGSPTNVEVASYVHDYLHRAAADLWLDHKRAKKLKSDAGRRTFLAGVMDGFAKKLAREAKGQRGAGLILANDPALAGYYRARHPYVRQVRYGSSGPSDAMAEGRIAGAKLEIRRGVGGHPQKARGLLGM